MGSGRLSQPALTHSPHVHDLWCAEALRSFRKGGPPPSGNTESVLETGGGLPPARMGVHFDKILENEGNK